MVGSFQRVWASCCAETPRQQFLGRFKVKDVERHIATFLHRVQRLPQSAEVGPCAHVEAHSHSLLASREEGIERLTQHGWRQVVDTEVAQVFESIEHRRLSRAAQSSHDDELETCACGGAVVEGLSVFRSHSSGSPFGPDWAMLRASILEKRTDSTEWTGGGATLSSGIRGCGDPEDGGA